MNKTEMLEVITDLSERYANQEDVWGNIKEVKRKLTEESEKGGRYFVSHLDSHKYKIRSWRDHVIYLSSSCGNYARKVSVQFFLKNFKLIVETPLWEKYGTPAEDTFIQTIIDGGLIEKNKRYFTFEQFYLGVDNVTTNFTGAVKINGANFELATATNHLNTDVLYQRNTLSYTTTTSEVKRYPFGSDTSPKNWTVKERLNLMLYEVSSAIREGFSRYSLNKRKSYEDESFNHGAEPERIAPSDNVNS